jgi:hypothetical protein
MRYVLFVNVFGDGTPGSGMTCAIRGPWRRVPFSSATARACATERFVTIDESHCATRGVQRIVRHWRKIRSD